MALGVGEHRDGGTFRHFRGLHHRAAPQALDPAQRRLKIRDRNVEADAANRCASPPIPINLITLLICAIGGVVGWLIILVLHLLGIAFSVGVV